MWTRAALVDTSLLLVLIVGLVERSLIGRFKRTDTYSEGDLDLLVGELRDFDRLITTPTILAEVSNHLGQLRQPAREEARLRLASMVFNWHEQYEVSSALMTDAEFTRIGLTDVAICDAAARAHTVFTADFDLYTTLARRGFTVVNFNHLRSARFGLQ
ncbi:MAG: hypothetical protein JWO05_1049 [Gemmatimonadetes bacterium]|nr:hypothetical protein [Gemmatimonadota bacterium]